MKKNKCDVIATIDLAEACIQYNGQNYKAAGVCYNNIGNLQYKNEKYKLAAENFSKAVHMSLVCLHQMKPREFYKMFPGDSPKDGNIQPYKYTLTAQQIRHFNVVKAHRFYSYTMCHYKMWRYNRGEQISKGHREKELLTRMGTQHVDQGLLNAHS